MRAFLSALSRAATGPFPFAAVCEVSPLTSILIEASQEVKVLSSFFSDIIRKPLRRKNGEYFF